jgi:hypothetical protein
LHHLDSGREYVSLPAYSLDDGWLARVIAQSLAQSTHLSIYAALKGIGFASLRQFHDLVATQHAVGVIE